MAAIPDWPEPRYARGQGCTWRSLVFHRLRRAVLRFAPDRAAIESGQARSLGNGVAQDPFADVEEPSRTACAAHEPVPSLAASWRNRARNTRHLRLSYLG